MARQRCLLTFLVVVASLGLGVIAAQADPITDEMRAQDARLNEPITISASDIYVGELMEQLSEKIGVSLSAGDRDGAAGERVSVFARDVPLWKIMDGLWAVFSYRDAQWLWLRSPSGKEGAATARPAWRYRLGRSVNAQHFAERIHQEISRQFEHDANEAIAALGWPPEKMAQAAVTNPEIDSIQKDETWRNGLATFAETLSARDQMRVLRAEGEVSIPVSELPETGRRYVESYTGRVQRLNPGYTHDVPTHLHFQSRNDGTLTPRVLLVLGGRDGGTSVSGIGGPAFESQWRERIAGQWLVKGDTPGDAPRDTQVLPKPRPLSADERKKILDALPASLTSRLSPDGLESMVRLDSNPYLERLSERAGVPIISHSVTAVGSAGTPTDTINSCVGVLEKSGTTGHKWHEGVLLVADHTWINRDNDDAKVPWSIIKRLRADRRDGPHGLIPVAELFFFAGHLTDRQLDRITEREFGYMVQVKLHRMLFAALDANKRLAERVLSQEGAALGALPPDVQVWLAAKTNHVKDSQTPERLRIKLEEEPAEGYPDPKSKVMRRSVRVQVLDRAGKAAAYSEFFYDGLPFYPENAPKQ